jgi:serine/threonine-protein kinase RsbW
VTIVSANFLIRSTQMLWNTISFSSTLYLCPILDLLLAEVPRQWHPEVRLGLQEALVNASRHGNQLDPLKTVLVSYAIEDTSMWWVICDQGCGFVPPEPDRAKEVCNTHACEQENGRGLYLLQMIFDQVHWSQEGRELRLYKEVSPSRQPLIA